jgi:hypothetical protein
MLMNFNLLTRLSPLVARSHRRYKLADTNTQKFCESLPATPAGWWSCPLRQQGGHLEWLAVIMQYALRQ